jgi:putative CocE/NonD family hydrolase
MLGRKEQFWQDFMDHPENDDYWRLSLGEQPRAGEMSAARYPQVDVPSLNISGWYDTMQQPTANNYMGMVQYGPKELRNKHMLIIGPWFHSVGPRKLGDLDFGEDAEVDFLPVELRWYDYWLKGIDNGILTEPRVNLFVMGRNQWRTENDWPPREAVEKSYYIHSRGRANTRFGDGTLSETPPASEPSDHFTYDPENPVPTFGGNTRSYPLIVGPKDQRSLQERQDVLVYTTPELDHDLEVGGRILVKLYASSDALDTDFTGKLVDVYPDGYASILKDGIIRARYRNSFKHQELLTPGSVYEYTIDLWSVCNVFKKGHRIQVEISSSNFPKYDRNPNTGDRFGEDSKLVPAHQTIYHNSRYASHIILPILP